MTAEPTPRRGVLGHLAPVAFLGALLVAWQVWVSVGDVAPWVMPGPIDVLQAGWNSRQTLLTDSITTVTEAVIGLVIGGVVGIAVGTAIDAIPTLRRAVWPIVVTSQTIPVIVLAPLFAIWFGFGLMPKIVMVALITFFPIAVSTVAGLSSAEEGQLDLVRSFGASRRQVLRMVRIPAAWPDVFAGVQIAAAYAIGDAVIGEYIGGTSGLGIFIDRSRASYRTDQMMAGVVVIALLSIALFGIVGLIGRRTTPWRRGNRTRQKQPALGPPRAQPMVEA